MSVDTLHSPWHTANSQLWRAALRFGSQITVTRHFEATNTPTFQVSLGVTLYRLVTFFLTFRKTELPSPSVSSRPTKWRWNGWPWRNRHCGTLKRQELITNIHSVTPLKTWIIISISVGNTKLAITFLWWSVTKGYQSARTNGKSCKAPKNCTLVQAHCSHDVLSIHEWQVFVKYTRRGKTA
jgi:hypothetical protein